MKRSLLYLLVFCLAGALAASAGTVTGKVKAGSGASVVYLEPVDAKAPAPPSKIYVMDQKGMQFTPHILIVPVGATVEFKNDDAAAHNVFWPSVGGDKKLSHNLGTFPKGQERTFKFDHAGVVPLLCNVHPEMSAYIIVTPSPYYAQTDQILGMYQIANVPDGKYKVTAWHQGSKPESKMISVSGSATADFDLAR